MKRKSQKDTNHNVMKEFRVLCPHSKHRLRLVSAFGNYPETAQFKLVSLLDADYNVSFGTNLCLWLSKNKIALSSARAAARSLKCNCGSDKNGDGAGFAHASFRLTSCTKKLKRRVDGMFTDSPPKERHVAMEVKQELDSKACNRLISTIVETKTKQECGELAIGCEEDAGRPHSIYLVHEFQECRPTDFPSDALKNLSNCALSLTRLCLLEEDQLLFNRCTSKKNLAKEIFISECTGRSHVKRHVDRSVAFGTVIFALADSLEQLRLWPGGHGCSSMDETGSVCTHTAWLNDSTNAVVFPSGVPHELPAPAKERKQPRHIASVFV